MINQYLLLDRLPSLAKITQSEAALFLRCPGKEMPTVNSEVFINAPVDVVWQTAQQVERFPEVMDDVKSIEVLERDEGRVVTKWTAAVADFGLKLKVRWTEEDIWDQATHTCRFRQLQGDYKEMHGAWEFVPQGEGTLFKSSLTLEYAVPGIGPMIRGIIAKLAKKNLDATLLAIKQWVESCSAA